METIQDQYLTIDGLAHRLNFSRSVAYHHYKTWIANGLRAFKICGSYRFRASDVDEWSMKKNRVTVG